MRPSLYPEAESAVATAYADIGGTLVVQSSMGSLHIYGYLTGLPPSTTAGWHVHAGSSCGTHAGVEGHYFTGDTDAWDGNTYTSDADGVAEIDFTVSGYSLMDDMAVAGRTLVVHSTTDRIACGLIIPTTAQIARIGTYPGYDGASPPPTPPHRLPLGPHRARARPLHSPTPSSRPPPPLPSLSPGRPTLSPLDARCAQAPRAPRASSPST